MILFLLFILFKVSKLNHWKVIVKQGFLLTMKGLNKTRKLSHYTNVTDIGLLKFHHRIARI